MSDSQKKIKIDNPYAPIGLFICIGLIVLGICIYKGFQAFTDRGRVVTVKGLAEQQIKSTEAIITLSASFSGNTIKDVVSKTTNEVERIKTYLKENGHDNFTIDDINIYDSKTTTEEDWSGGKLVLRQKDRYYVSQNIVLTIKDVEQAEHRRNKMELDLLVNNNVTCDVACNYIFPALNDIKPALIAESTKNARIAGEQFAKDSESKLGKIQTASQGQISISGEYDYNASETVPFNEKPYMQNVRVVSSIVFFLED